MSSDLNELAEALIGQSAHAAPAHILEGLPEDVAQRKIAGAPHTIYQELWHIVFWQQMTLDWISGAETLFPANAADPFPTEAQAAAELWPDVCRRFLAGANQAAQAASDVARLNVSIRCPSRPGQPVRIMTVQDQLISLAAHNAYHFGRIVLLRQLLGCWPPTSGGFTW